MKSIYTAIKYSEPDKYYLSYISFGDSEVPAPVPSGLGNTDFLPEERVASTFARLTGITEDTALALLRGTAKIEDVPELEYCVPLKQSQKTVVNGLYYYSLPNGIHLVGLDEQHDAVKLINSGGSVDAVEYPPEVTDVICYTKGSKKRSRRQVIPSGTACILHMPDPVTITLPDDVRRFDVIETNQRLVNDPSLLAKPDEGWILMLMDKTKTCRQPKHKRN
ncbi:hypothetical protein BBOV_III002145 [Babesia bovis T2Bo]|uniref:hypothetical protein n=1 Tax=Babesia bovis T2Bo TaxID=484906 RepID=UPI001C35F40D|nr:hypothetical protein BBOV_III002145 [Babesia bovis T2Bo]KAG6440046.1 hypothetical protein BBOV_III002145 [Babesia bovis T2Bo]